MCSSDLPLYNRLLKQDKTYKYICLRDRIGQEALSATYRRGKDGVYYGPYDKHTDLRCVVDVLKTYYRLPQCTTPGAVEDCLPYRLGNCKAPCLPKQVHLLNESLIDLRRFLDGESEAIIDDYASKMQAAAEALDFDQAIKYRNIYYSLRQLSYKQEAVRVTLAQIPAIALIPMPVGGTKVYLLRGNRIIYTFYFSGRERMTTQYNKLSIAYNTYLATNTELLEEVSKHEVDYSYITYTYLKNHKEIIYVQQIKEEISKVFIKRLLNMK